MIIGLTGKRGVGKDTAANYLVEKYGFRILNFSRDILTPILEKDGKPITRDNLIELAMNGRNDSNNNGIWAEKLCDIIKDNEDYTISGIRFMEEVDVFKKRFGDEFILISISCKDRTRYDRCRMRGTKGEGMMTLGEFMEREKRPTEAAILKVVKLADFVIDNNETHEQLFERMDRIVKHLKEKR